MQQKQLGQFYTHKNIFKNIGFIKWFNNIPNEKKHNILEPFAGSNGIIKMLDELGFIKYFTSFDIMPTDKDVLYKDTLLNFPTGYSVGITNPPFLAKNSATRRDLQINFTDFNDLYELCLLNCLENLEYIAAIIPESFITNQQFDKTRLHAVISLAEKKIFKDTEHPVCLALFNPEPQQDYKLYRNDEYLGTYKELQAKEMNLLLLPKVHEYKIYWHNPEGQIGLEVIDATEKNKKMCFFNGENIPKEEVNFQSRLRTRILILDKNNKIVKKARIKKLIKDLNIYLNLYRENTQDIFLTAFKGLRNDGMYRRRLDFTKARILMEAGLNNICYNESLK